MYQKFANKIMALHVARNLSKNERVRHVVIHCNKHFVVVPHDKAHSINGILVRE